jgi:CheY-like chemotaxis protein
VLVADADGSNLHQLTNYQLDGGRDGLAWSPNGRLLTFSTRLIDHPQIYVIRPEGTGLNRLTNRKNGSISVGPVWSPDSKRILFHSYHPEINGGQEDLWIVKPNGEGRGCGGSPPRWIPSPRARKPRPGAGLSWRPGASHDAAPGRGCHHPTVRPTLLIVDDHAEFRASARALLGAEGFDVIGEAADGEEAIEAVARLRPQVVLLDVQLPGMDGMHVAEVLAASPDPPAVVLVSSRDRSAYGRRLRETSARGFIPKNELSGQALAALVD